LYNFGDYLGIIEFYPQNWGNDEESWFPELGP
jgi:hypothetical protein